MKQIPFEGVCTALVTPFDDTGIDFSTFDRLLERQVNAGIDTVLVFSGETTREVWQQSDIRPTYTAENISEILPYLK